MNDASSGLAVVMVLARRDLVRFLRQPARVAAAIGTPVLLWLFMGSGFAGAFRPAMLDEVSYTAFLLPGVMTLVAVFTSIFASISIIEDRQAGWLQSVLVAPVPRWSIALGKIAGGSFMAWLQAALLLAAVPFVGMEASIPAVLIALAGLALTCIAMTALGAAFAWRSDTTSGFHAVMNLVFMPMWLLSGAFFPPPVGASTWLGWLMWINPLTWCTQAIRQPLLGQEAMLPLLGALAFAAVMMVIATAMVTRPTTAAGT